MKEAMLYEVTSDGRVRCLLCSHYCTLSDGMRGRCGVRECRDGKLFSLVNDRVVALHVDPIEKKPLFHFLPGSNSLSLATMGCNFRCQFCQNHSISQLPPDLNSIPGEEVSPEELAQMAEDRDCRSISYTYTEPTVFYELARATGILARRRGVKNVFVSNGYMSRETLASSQEFLDAANVDLKSYSDEFYRRYCGARLQPVLDSIRTLAAAGIWVEVTTLVIPGLNDSETELRQIAEFLVSVTPSLPWHVSAFHPDYKLLDRPPTSAAILEKAWELGRRAGLKYIYCGNVPGHPAENTYCPGCGQLLIERRGFAVRRNLLQTSRCPSCNDPIEIILDKA